MAQTTLVNIENRLGNLEALSIVLGCSWDWLQELGPSGNWCCTID